MEINIYNQSIFRINDLIPNGRFIAKRLGGAETPRQIRYVARTGGGQKSLLRGRTLAPMSGQIQLLRVSILH